MQDERNSAPRTQPVDVGRGTGSLGLRIKNGPMVVCDVNGLTTEQARDAASRHLGITTDERLRAAVARAKEHARRTGDEELWRLLYVAPPGQENAPEDSHAR